MALQKDICWYKCRLFMRSSNPLWHFHQDMEIEKSIAPQQKISLCCFPQSLLHHVSKSCDEFTIGGLAFVGADGIAEVTV